MRVTRFDDRVEAARCGLRQSGGDVRLDGVAEGNESTQSSHQEIKEAIADAQSAIGDAQSTVTRSPLSVSSSE